MWTINFYSFYISFRSRNYDDSIKYLGLAQKYVAKIMDEELPGKAYTVHQVKEEDEETEK